MDTRKSYQTTPDVPHDVQLVGYKPIDSVEPPPYSGRYNLM